MEKEMTALERILQTSVPPTEQPIVDLFRKWIGDTEETNTLEAVKESDDLDLYRALIMSLNQINYEIPPLTEYDFTEIPNVKMLLTGALLQLLVSKGIVSARNTLTYNDAGGVTVQDYDRYGRYVNFFNILISGHINSIRMWKTTKNIEDCYGGVDSEYSLINRFGV